MTDTVKAPAAGTAQGLRMVVQQDSSNSPEHKATNGHAQVAIDWRDHLAVHPSAEAFPPLSEKELKELAGDIERNDLKTDFVLWQADKNAEPVLLDGRNRLDALAILGKLALNGPELCVKRADGSLRQVKSFKTIIGGDPEKLAYSLNLHRRHLTPGQKRELIARLLKAKPEVSDRQIGKQLKADNKTVAAVRSDLERREEIPHVEARTDTKGRKQPATKARKQPKRKGWLTENERKWRDLWVAEGRSLADYRAGLNDPTGAVWKWRRAKGREAIERERQAWLADHPDQTSDDYDRVTTCAASAEDEAAYLEWLRGRKAERRETLAVEAARLASKLIELDRDTARAVHDLLRTVGGDIRLMCALAHRLDGDAS